MRRFFGNLRAFLVALWFLCQVAITQRRRIWSGCFLTGSRAFGKPQSESDWDFAVYMPTYRAGLLRYISDLPGGPCYFGNVNFIIETDFERFNKWRDITNQLIQQRPVTREKAVEVFTAAGLTNQWTRPGQTPSGKK